MARIDNLTNFLTDVAGAIKAKKGDNTNILAANFDTEIANIDTVNGEQITITPTTQQQVITPSQGKNAITQATVSAVNASIDQNIQASNIKKDVTILGVTGTLDPGSGGGGDAKIFETEQAMQADPDKVENGLATIYAIRSAEVDENSEFNSCIFPNTVVLDEAFSDDIYGSFRAVDQSVMFSGMVEMSSSSFRFEGWGESGEINVEYTSQDGITYTRTDGGEELQEFGTTIKYEPTEPWNDAIGNFMIISSNYYGGLFTAKYTVTGYTFAKLKNLSADVTNKTMVQSGETMQVQKTNMDELIDKCGKYMMNAESLSTTAIYASMFINDGKLIIAYTIDNSATYFRRLMFIYNSSTGKYDCLCSNDSTHASFYEYRFDLATGEYIDKLTHTFESTVLSNKLSTNYFAEYYYVGDLADPYALSEDTYVMNNSTGASTKCDAAHNVFSLRYFPAKSQLTLVNTNQLLPDVMAYGSNGIITGSDEIYDNLDNEKIIDRVIGFPSGVVSPNNYPSISEGITDGYHFNYCKYNTFKLKPYRVYHIENTSQTLNEGNFALVHKHNLPATMTENSGIYSYSVYDAYTDTYIFSKFGKYSWTSGDYPYHFGVFDSAGNTLIESQFTSASEFTNITGSSAAKAFYYNNKLYFPGYNALSRLDNNTVTTVATYNRYDAFAVDYVQGFLYGVPRSTSNPIIKININTGAITNVVNNGIGVCGNTEFVCYTTQTTFYYKKLTDTTFKSVSFDAKYSSDKSSWRCINIGNSLFIINSGSYAGDMWKIDYDTNTITFIASDSNLNCAAGVCDVYNDKIYACINTGDVYEITQSGEVTQLLNSYTCTPSYPNKPIKFDMISDISYKMVKSVGDYATVFTLTEHTIRKCNLVEGHGLNKTNCISYAAPSNEKLYLLSWNESPLT